ncbi:hypothetical protein CSA56_07050 [candidate division KSB3 bacterium]|uniref:Uncharacterized protein n=1 Tax=candidate division KSB3 bacterium TaxID=2044937 RepID=A0A2G6KG88_9BACT|nr:MAG: hypothetical protein CSA56_07050 [candidate division KSB3 bacterium]
MTSITWMWIFSNMKQKAHRSKVNEVYVESFSEGEPLARTCVEISGLAKGAKVEIDAIALILCVM